MLGPSLSLKLRPYKVPAQARQAVRSVLIQNWGQSLAGPSEAADTKLVSPQPSTTNHRKSNLMNCPGSKERRGGRYVPVIRVGALCCSEDDPMSVHTHNQLNPPSNIRIQSHQISQWRQKYHNSASQGTWLECGLGGGGRTECKVNI